MNSHRTCSVVDAILSYLAKALAALEIVFAAIRNRHVARSSSLMMKHCNFHFCCLLSHGKRVKAFEHLKLLVYGEKQQRELQLEYMEKLSHFTRRHEHTVCFGSSQSGLGCCSKKYEKKIDILISVQKKKAGHQLYVNTEYLRRWGEKTDLRIM